MPLSSEDQEFLRRRRRILSAWPWIAGVLVVSLGGLVAWLLLRQPLLANPLEVMQALREGSLDPGTTALLAGLMPVMADLCLLLVFVLVIYASAYMHVERRYQRIITALRDDHGADGPRGARER